MNLIEYTINELNIINYENKDKIINIINIIYKQSHSKISMKFIINIIENKKFNIETEEINENLLKQLKNNFDEIKPLIEELDKNDIDIIIKLLNYHPLSPLTLEDDEWDLNFNNIYRNKRLNSLFKEGKNKEVKFSDGVICVNEKGNIVNLACVCSKESSALYFLHSLKPKQLDEFPKIKIKVIEEEIYTGNYITYTTEKELDKLRKYYEIPSAIYK